MSQILVRGLKDDRVESLEIAGLSCSCSVGGLPAKNVMTGFEYKIKVYKVV